MYGPVTVIGGANMDINGFSQESLSIADSNPGRVEYCPGGVGRNIAENLHRLGTDVRLISVIGNDPGGALIRLSAANIGLNIEHSLFIKSENQVTSVYIALMDSNGEMKLALADMNIMEQMTEEHLKGKADIIEESAIVLLDTNLPERIIGFILKRFGGNSKPLFFLDAVSAKKAPKALPYLGFFDTLKLSRMEASALTGIEIPSGEVSQKLREKLIEAAHILAGKGVRRVFITLGKNGVFVHSAGSVAALLAGKSAFYPVSYIKPVNTSGAGDAFMAGIVYGTLRGWEEEAIVSFSLAMSGITVQGKSTVSPDMCLALVEKNVHKTLK